MPSCELSIGSVICSLQQVPVPFHAVRTHVAVYVLAGFVIYYAVLVSGGQSVIALPRIGADGRACLNVLDDLPLKRVGSRIGYYHCPHVATTLPKSEYDSLGKSALPHLLPLVGVHGLRFLPDVSLVYLNGALHLLETARFHSAADTMQQKPCGFLAHAERTGDFHRGDAVLRATEKPERRKPDFQFQRTVFHDRANLDGELLFTWLALPDTAGRDKAKFPASAEGAADAVGPTDVDHVSECPVRIGKVFDRLNECLRSVLGIHAVL